MRSVRSEVKSAPATAPLVLCRVTENSRVSFRQRCVTEKAGRFLHAPEHLMPHCREILRRHSSAKHVKHALFNHSNYCTVRATVPLAEVDSRGGSYSRGLGRGALGAVTPVGGWVHPATHLCNGARTDACESDEDRAGNSRLLPCDDGQSGRDTRNTGANDNRRAGAARDGNDRAGTDQLPAPSCYGFRTGPLDANTSFMYDNPTRSYMNEALRPGFT
jgi:hypothetical protein